MKIEHRRAFIYYFFLLRLWIIPGHILRDEVTEDSYDLQIHDGCDLFTAFNLVFV